MARGTRPRQLRLSVYVTPEELQDIDAGAKAAGQSHSAYLRNVGLNYQSDSLFAPQAIHQLKATLHEQNEHGSMLKQWLAEGGQDSLDIRGLLRQIEDVQNQMARIVMRGFKRR